MRSIGEITANIMEYAIASDMFVCKNIARLCDELNNNSKQIDQEIEDNDSFPKKLIEKKIFPEYFSAVKEGRKNFEIRKDEDNAEEGDELVLREFDGKAYTGRVIKAKILYVLRDIPQYGLKEGYCIMGIKPK